jgi:hypothetical protein
LVDVTPNNAFQRDAAAFAAVPSLALGAAERGRWASHMLRSLVASSALALAGCVGVDVLHTHEFSERGALPGKSRATVVTQENVHLASGARPGKVELRKAWGDPDRISTSGDTERWIYHDGLRWNGLVLFAVLPVPLLIPVGHEYVAVDFQGDSLINVETKSQAEMGGACPMIEGPCAYIAPCEWWHRPKKGQPDSHVLRGGSDVLQKSNY